jgi:hypothetical protein
MVVHFPAVTGYPLGITRNPRTIVHSELHIASFYSLAPSSSDLVHVGGVEDILKYIVSRNRGKRCMFHVGASARQPRLVSACILSSWAKRNSGRCGSSSSEGSSKIKIRTPSWHRANCNLFDLCHDEVRILIFDNPAELEKQQLVVMVRFDRGPFRPTPHARAARARCIKFFRKFTKSRARWLRGRRAPIPY